MASKNYPTPEELRNLLDYCPDTGVLTWRKREDGSRESKIFNAQFAGKQAGSKGNRGYLVVGFSGMNGRNCDKYLAHRVALMIHHGCICEEIDHTNHIRTDNRLCNLRFATRQENCINASMRSNNTSGFTGVSWDSRRQKWAVLAQQGNVKHFIGRYESMIDAIAARIGASNMHGFHENHGANS